MYIVKRSVTLHPRADTSSFIKENILAIGSRTVHLGANITASNKIAANSNELQYYLRHILGTDPSATGSNWTAAIKMYLDGISVDVTLAGKQFDISLEFDINDVERSTFITATIEQAKKSTPSIVINTDEELAKYIISTKKEEEYYRYSMPVNAVDYLNWRYCLVHSEVANSINDVDKTAKIRFYLYTDAEDTIRKEKAHTTNLRIMSKILEVLADSNYARNVLYAINSNREVIVDVTEETLNNDVLLGTELERVARAHPNEFLTIVDDKNLKMRAKIEKLIISGILFRLVDSTVIVDATNRTDVIGRNINEAIIYFDNPANAATVSEYLLRYKNLKQQ